MLFFSCKINNFWQQKQLLLFLSNMTPKVLLTKVVLLRHSYWGYTALFREKTTIFGAPWLKKGPHRRFGGSSVAEIFIFLISNKNCPLFVKKFFSYLGSTKSYRPPQFFAQSVTSSFFWHQFTTFRKRRI